MQNIHLIDGVPDVVGVIGSVLSDPTRLMHHHNNNYGLLVHQQQPEALRCPRCDSDNTKFCYYNNYNFSQPRHFCRTCRRYWTKGGVLRNVPVGGGCRKSSSSSKRLPYSRKLHDKSSPSSSGSSKAAAAPAAAGRTGHRMKRYSGGNRSSTSTDGNSNAIASTAAPLHDPTAVAATAEASSDTTSATNATDGLITGVPAAARAIFLQLPVSESSNSTTSPTSTTATVSCSTNAGTAAAAAAGAAVNFSVPQHNNEYVCCPWIISTGTVLFDFQPNAETDGGGPFGEAAGAFPDQAAGGDKIAALLPIPATYNDDEEEGEGNWKAAAQDLCPLDGRSMQGFCGNFELPMVRVDDPWLLDCEDGVAAAGLNCESKNPGCGAAGAGDLHLHHYQGGLVDLHLLSSIDPRPYYCSNQSIDDQWCDHDKIQQSLYLPW